jgi:hypothetical protein
MGHVHHEDGADSVGDLPHALEIDSPGIAP